MTVPAEPAPEAGLDVPVTTEWTGGAAVLRVSGDVDYAETPQLKALISATLAQHPTLAVIDLLRVGFLGSAGLALLVEVTLAADTQVRVVASSAALRAVRLTGLESFLDLYPTVDEALAV